MKIVLNDKVKKFIEENIYLIGQNKWEEVYNKNFPTYFTETLLECGINPLEQGLNYIPDNFLYKSSIKEFTIPGDVTNIGSCAFYNCNNLTNIIIPDSVKRIGAHAFDNCISLTSTVIPNGVTSIDKCTFHTCKSLTSIIIPDNVTSIGIGAFSNCESLTNIKIPNSVTSIDGSAFYNCKSLTYVVIPDSVTNIGNYAFLNCKSLTTINYLGTKKEAMKLGIGNRSRKKWREDSAIQKIICIDGEIEL